MPYGISIKSQNNTANEIVRLWGEASAFEPHGSMQELNYPPHLTLAVFPNDPGDITAILEGVFSSQPELTITFEAIEFFDNEMLVLWAKPRFHEALLSLHTKLHSYFDPTACHEHYRVGRWVPHCSLATQVPPLTRGAAIAWAQRSRPDFSVVFDVADLVQFPPVLVQREIRLG